MITLESIPPHIQDRLNAYANAVNCPLVQVIQVAIADFIEFEGTELSYTLPGEVIFEGLSIPLQNEVRSFLHHTYADHPDRDKFDTDYLVVAAIQFFLHMEATSFDDPELTEEPIRTELRQIGVLHQYLGSVPIAA